jgi:diguanylate cyclase (GGDEF)-like protein
MLAIGIELFKQIDMNLLTVLVLAVLLYAIRLQTDTHRTTPGKLFIALIVINLLLAVIDSCAWLFNTLPYQRAFMANWFFNILLFLLTPLTAGIWVLYVHYQLFKTTRKLKKVLYLLLLPISINAALTLISIRTGWFFTITVNNAYQRGPLFLIHIGIVYLLILISYVMLIRNRPLLHPQHFVAMCSFCLPPLVGSIMQSLVYGLLLNWSSMMVGILILYLWIQNRSINTDPLTGVYNRRHFDRILLNKIKRSRQPFALIVADLDSFKKINDQYGHVVGDEALIQAVHLLRHVVREDDLIARFGGDEFYILLDVDNKEQLCQCISRIRNAFDQHQAHSENAYRLSISLGAALYDPDQHETASQFIKAVDDLMYCEKNCR